MEMINSQGTTATDPGTSREVRFVAEVIQKCRQNKGIAACLRRADNPATEYQSWELLAKHGINLEHETQRLPFVMVAAAIAKAKCERNGTLSLGRALVSAYDDGRDSGPAKARLRRLLACDDISEVCRILRQVLSLIDSKVSQPLDYIRLLKQMQRFSFNGQQVKAQWAQEFYSQPAKNPEGA